MKGKSVLSKLLIVILLASFVGVFFVMSIMDLTNTKDVRDVKVKHAYSILTVEHSINGIIPTGKSYYYIGITEDAKACLIHAGKNWLEGNFDAEGNATNAEGYKIHALGKRENDYDVEKELLSKVSQLEGITVDEEIVKILELHYVRDAVLRIVAGIMAIILGIVGFFLYRRKEVVPLWARRTYLVFFVLVLIFALKAII